MKICNKEDCSHGGMPQLDENFYPDRHACKTCVLERHRLHHAEYPEKKAGRELKRKYGLTLADYDQMFADQDGRCGICGTQDPGGPNRCSRFAVDHNHETGKVRALLCAHCNKGLGLFKDDPDLLRDATDYLENHK